MSEKLSHGFTIRFPGPLHRRLKRFATVSGMKPTDFVRQAVAKELDAFDATGSLVIRPRRPAGIGTQN